MDFKRILLAIGVVAFVIIVSIVIFSIDWGGGGSDPNAPKPVNIADYNTTDTKVRMTVRGPVNSNQEHQVLVMTVGRDQTIGELMSGYQGNVVRTEQTGSNPTAYKTFLSALHNANFTALQDAPKDLQYDGACPKGLRYTFEFVNAGSDAPQSSWTTSCGKRFGTFAGDSSLVEWLFENQLPEAQYDALTLDTQF